MLFYYVTFQDMIEREILLRDISGHDWERNLITNPIHDIFLQIQAFI